MGKALSPSIFTISFYIFRFSGDNFATKLSLLLRSLHLITYLLLFYSILVAMNSVEVMTMHSESATPQKLQEEKYFFDITFEGETEMIPEKQQAFYDAWRNLRDEHTEANNSPDEAKLALNRWASVTSSHIPRSLEPSALAWLRPLRLADVGSPTEQAGQPSAADELEDTQNSEEEEWYDDDWNQDEYTQYEMDETSWSDDDSGDLELELAELHRAAEEEGWNEPPLVMAEERWIVWCGRLKKNCWSDTPVEDDGYWDDEGIWVRYDTKTKIKKERKVAKKGRRR